MSTLGRIVHLSCNLTLYNMCTLSLSSWHFPFILHVKLVFMNEWSNIPSSTIDASKSFCDYIIHYQCIAMKQQHLYDQRHGTKSLYMNCILLFIYGIFVIIMWYYRKEQYICSLFSFFTPQPLRAPGYCRTPSGRAGGRQGRQAPLTLSRP